MNSSRGRPSDPEKQQQQKQKLLQAARDLIGQKPYKSVSIRELAELAGVNSAMIRYYFENKAGLFTALFEEMAHLHFSHIQALMQADDPVRLFIQRMLQMVCDNREMVRFIHDEVLSEESELKDAFFNNFPKRVAHFLPLLLEKMKQQGQLRENLNTKHAAFSLMGLIMIPIVAAPVREEVWHISIDEIRSPEWVEHIYQLFMAGCRKENS